MVPKTLAFLLYKFQGRRIHAVAQTGWCRAVLEDVTKMRVALFALHLGSGHSVGAICLSFDILFVDRRPETRPAGAGIKLCVGAEECIAAAHTPVHPLFVVIPIAAGKGPLRSSLAGNLELFWRQLLFPLLFAEYNLVHGHFPFLLSGIAELDDCDHPGTRAGCPDGCRRGQTANSSDERSSCGDHVLTSIVPS